VNTAFSAIIVAQSAAAAAFDQVNHDREQPMRAPRLP